MKYRFRSDNWLDTLSNGNDVNALAEGTKMEMLMNGGSIIFHFFYGYTIVHKSHLAGATKQRIDELELAVLMGGYDE